MNNPLELFGFDVAIGSSQTIHTVITLRNTATQEWPGWLGGYEAWSKGRHPMSNSLAFFQDTKELRHATMLEF